MKALIIFLTLSLQGFQSFSQTDVDVQSSVLTQKMQFYNANDRPVTLFAHFDKTIYASSENVWFTAYLINSNNESKNNVLSVCLVSDIDHSILLQEKFVMAQGIACGNILLPDSIPTGDYSFILYTNNVIKGKPVAIFTQAVTIKNTAPHAFNAFLALLDTGKNAPGGFRKVQLVTDTRGSKIVAGVPVDYYVGNKLHPLMTGTILTDKAGQYVFEIPAKDVEPGHNVLVAKISYDKEVRYVQLALPVNGDVPLLKFYPEGGNLTAGLVNTVGWEAKNAAGRPCKIKGVLYAGQQAVDTVETNTYGMGRFRIIPQRQCHYHVKLIKKDAVESDYGLPNVITGTPELTLRHALANDTLAFIIRSTQNQRVFIAVHNYRELFFLFPVEINASPRKIAVLLTNLPKGIAEITILDSLKRPCAERLFFAHYTRRAELAMATDADEYHTREKVTLKMRFRSDDSIPPAGLVSVACVQKSRLDPNKTKDIESYLYLTDEVGALGQQGIHQGIMAADQSYLEDILLIKGWRKYNWVDMMASAATDTIPHNDTLNFDGMVTRNGKPLKKTVKLLEMRSEKLSALATDSKGHFLLKDTDMMEQADKKVYLFVANNDNDDYDFKLNDPYIKINQSLAAKFEPLNSNYAITAEQQSNDVALPGFEHAVRLKEVKIKDNASFHFFAVHANNCGDYVCRYSILNCHNHPNEADNIEPIPGQKYMINGINQIYYGCNVNPHNYNHVFKGIYYSMQFYGSDYEKINPSQPEFVSTIFWKHICRVDAKGETQLSFFTGDIAGPFKIIVQGITNSGVVYAEKTITVIKKH